MLQIYTDNQLTDIAEDISVDLVYENPIFSTDRIPATYSWSYDLPLTPRNRTIFGNPDRVASAGNRFRDHPTRILFAGIEIANGVQTIEEISNETITVNFSGSVLPECIDQKMYKAPLGEIVLSYFLSGQDSAQIAITDYDGQLRENQVADNAPFVACPIAVKEAGSETTERDPNNIEDTFLITRKSFLNLVDQNLNYIHFIQGTEGTRYMLKILPAIKVWYLFERIFGEKLERNIFNEGEWSRLCLQTLWHPNFNLTDNLPPWSSEMQDGVNKKILRWADFMPDITVADFVVELLKLPGCTMFIAGDHFAIEYNADVLARKVYRDLKLEDGYTISLEAGQHYELGFSSQPEPEQADVTIKDVDNIKDGLRAIDNGECSAFRSKYPPQVLQTDGGQPCLTEVKAYQTENNETEDDEDSIESYDMTIKAQAVQCNVRQWWYNDDDMAEYTATDRWYIPEIERIETKRPDTILLGLYQGIQDAMRFPYQEEWHYPYLSSSNYEAHGEKLGELSLDFDSDSGPSKMHEEFKKWIERDKVVISGKTILTALDLQSLDFRDKYCILGRYFFIRTMNVSIKKDRIEPAEIELVEA